MTATRDSRASAAGLLARGPILLPAAAAAGVLVYLSVKDAGYEPIPVTWQYCALFAVALLTIGLVVVPRAGGPDRLVVGAACLLGAYAAWSYLSITWAGQTADALDGANRSALYAVVFALFALWPLGRRGAALLVGTLVAALGVVAVVALLKVRAADGGAIGDLFVGGRLAWPVSYPNAGVALWFVPFWPAVALASHRGLHPALRGAFVACAVVFSGAAMLGQSRGWLFAVPLLVVLVLALSPGRVRTAWTLIGVGLATLVMAAPALDVLDAFGEPVAVVAAEIDSAVSAILVTALAAGVIAAAAAHADRRVRVGAVASRRTGAAMAVAAVAVLMAGFAVFVAREGDPVAWVDGRWEEFKGGPQPSSGEGARFTQTLGSNRYDFWRVGWDNFERRPLAGVGADNFRHDYLRARRSYEEPYYPHSLPIRVLSQTGLVGGALLAAALALAFAAALRSIRRRRGLPAVTAAGAAAGAAYFFVHGAVDWFWELPALGGLAFALLGVAAGLQPRAAVHPRTRAARAPLAGSPRALGAVALAGAALLVAYLPPLLGDRATVRARDTFNADPRRAGDALDLLDRAAGLRRGSVVPRLLQAQIVVALGRPRLAAGYYRDAIRRDPRDVYAHIALAAVEAGEGRGPEAERLARRASELSPRDELARDVLERVRDGRRVTIYDVNQDFRRRLVNRGK